MLALKSILADAVTKKAMPEVVMIDVVEVQAGKQGLYDITASVGERVAGHHLQTGLATLFIRHTSASLLIQENADPSVCHDLERWLNRFIPEGDSLYTHNAEGLDDMPAHVKASLLATSLAIPVLDSQLALGTWQGIFLWEHRRFRGHRQILLHLQGTKADGTSF